MAWKAELMDVYVGSKSIHIRVKIFNDAVVIDPGPPIEYLNWSISQGYTDPTQVTLANITAWIRAEIARVKGLYDKAQTLTANIGTVITL